MLFAALFLLSFTVVLPLITTAAPLQPPPNLNPYPSKPRLAFTDSGTFKITVFSDLHYGENPWDVWGPVQDINSTRLMNIVLASEKPDYA